jgi:predicted nucleotidyltransferase
MAILDRKTLNTITDEIVQASEEVLGPRLCKVLLYGSYARGDYSEESDIDIFVLADIKREESLQLIEDIRDAACGADIDYGVFVSINVVDTVIFNEYIEAVPYYRNVIKDGVNLYVA